MLFPQLVRAAGGGWARSGLPASERVFKAKLREWAGASGMEPWLQRRVTPHSLRAGGATDWFALNASMAQVQQQGGWLTTEACAKYNRPLDADLPRHAAWLRRACLLAAGDGGDA